MAQRNSGYSDTNTISRRTILRTGATLAALGVAGTTPTGAQSGKQLPLEIEIYAEDEYIVITNTGDEAVDLTGYSVNFEAPMDDYDQSRALAGEVVIEAGDSITVPTGAREVVTGTIVELEEPYDGEVLNNENPDIVAVFDEQGNVVATSDGSGGDDEIGAMLSVTVEDQGGNAVPGIEVVGIGPDAEIYSTDANENGVASYDGLPAGDYEFHATVDGTDYEESTTESISLEDGDDETLTVTVTDTDESDDDQDDNGDAADGDDDQDDDGASDGDSTDEPADDGSDEQPARESDETDDCPKR